MEKIMRQARINRVEYVLENYPRARHDQKYLCVQVWRLEGCHSLDEVLIKGSSPSGILRDRRRTHILQRFPRDDEKFEHFKEYRDEFGSPILFDLEKV